MFSIKEELKKHLFLFENPDFLNKIPRPILSSYLKIEKETNPKLALQDLCLSLIPLTFQYFALLLSSEYLNSTNPPAFKVTESLWNMIKRPGPGKWVGFIREAVIYFKANETIVIDNETIDQFYGTLVANNKPVVTLLDKSGKPQKKYDLWEALVNIRNQFAHGRGFNEENSKVFFDDYFLIWKILISLCSNIFNVTVLLIDPDLENYFSLDNTNEKILTLSPKETNMKIIVWNRESKKYLRIFPLVITEFDEEEKNSEALFLEEVKGKSLTYLFKDGFIQRKEEYKDLITLLEKRTEKLEGVSSTEITASILGERIDRETQRTLTNFQDAKKYIPEMFVQRPSIENTLNKWLQSDKPGCILLGKPGTGKTSIVADWCVNKIKEDNHVLLLEASKLGKSDLSDVVKKKLYLTSSLGDCFRSVFEQIKNNTIEERKYFIIIIDAVNEFVGEGLDNRGLLWREINSLIDKLDDYSPYFKCLVTFRYDLWKSDFPRKDSADHILKRRLYYSQELENEFFPHILIGDLNDQEAELIYEKARMNIPGMSPVTSYSELPTKTKLIIKNPFLLRITLQTFHNQEVPSLSINKLHSLFAKEKALKEKEKVDILFKLLERMTEFDKTEISIDEFVYGKDKKASEKKKDEENILSKIIFDPKENSPYKELLNEGLIEEHSKFEDKDVVETISFAQEKVSNIIAIEQKRGEIKKILRLWKYISIPLLFFILSPILFLKEVVINYRYSLLEPVVEFITTDLLNSTKDLITTFHSLMGVKLSMFLLILIIFWVLIDLLDTYIKYLAFIMVSRDLPSKFLKSKFTNIYQNIFNKYVRSAIIFLFLIYIIINFNKWLYDADYSQLIEDVIILFLYVIIIVAIGHIIIKIFVTLKHSKNSSNAFILFGPKEVLNDMFSIGILILNLLLIILIFTKAINILDISSDKNLNIQYEKFVTSPDLISLKESKPEIAEFIESKVNIFYPADIKESISSLKTLISKAIFYCLIIMALYIFVHIMLTYFIAFPLEKHLRKRLKT